MNTFTKQFLIAFALFCSGSALRVKHTDFQIATEVSEPMSLAVDESKLTALKQERVANQCEDIQMADSLEPVVRSLSTFFEKKNDIAIHPWILTGLSALRHGGISLPMNAKKEVFDHDLDFLVHMPTSTKQDVLDKLAEWRSFLKRTTGIQAYEIDPPEEYNSHKDGSYHVTMVVDRPTLITNKAKEQSREVLEKMFVKLRGHSPDPDQKRRLFEAAPWKHNGTMIDFAVTFRGFNDSPPSHKRPDYSLSQKRMFFLGSDFPVPNNLEQLHKDIIRTYGLNEKIRNTNNLCDFEVPMGLWEEDPKHSVELDQKVLKCSKILDKHGFASMHRACPKSDHTMKLVQKVTRDMCYFEDGCMGIKTMYLEKCCSICAGKMPGWWNATCEDPVEDMSWMMMLVPKNYKEIIKSV